MRRLSYLSSTQVKAMLSRIMEGFGKLVIVTPGTRDELVRLMEAWDLPVDTTTEEWQTLLLQNPDSVYGRAQARPAWAHHDRTDLVADTIV